MKFTIRNLAPVFGLVCFIQSVHASNPELLTCTVQDPRVDQEIKFELQMEYSADLQSWIPTDLDPTTNFYQFVRLLNKPANEISAVEVLNGDGANASFGG